VTTKITFANMLAELCERIPGGNIDVVTNALGLDRRIGHKYLKSALGYGGPCFPRDNVALSFIARALGSSADLAEVTDRMNRTLSNRVIERLKPLIRKGMTVAVLGLAYKPGSHVVEESQGIYLARLLAGLGVRVLGYDPLANEMARVELQDQALILESLEECISQADMVLITTPDPIFRSLTAADFDENSSVIVVDFWRILEKELAGRENIRYIPVGRSLDDEANAQRLQELWGIGEF